ncbi:MAG: DUF4424 domain-containing protein [Ignavibacteriales bacterium]|nr:MAG: DUF4424 domain-containing protein [Ignavibacteriales bacterium]
MKHQGIVKLILLLPILISFSKTIPQSFYFSEEIIEIKIYEDYADVYGAYLFKSNSESDIKSTLYYPFPVSDSYPYPEEIKVFDKYYNEIHFTELSSGIYFSISLLPDSVSLIKVFYRQKLNTQTMKYILTTTRQWKRPLEKGEYVISLPEEFELKTLSLTPYSREIKSSRNIFHIKKENFMPETDLIISWAGRKK